jgi:ABC-2 type transport system ATP-binding protein
VTERVIELAGVGKRYTKYEDAPMLITRALRFRARTKRSKLWAVRGIDLEIGKGECVGVIGRNGSGKSTMLTLLAGVTGPTEGRVAVRGRVAPLIAVGVGFHPELTGRENVYVNGSVLGMTREEIDKRFDDILDFAEVTPFIDTPVKFYSSGMQVRLGFAVAVAANPEILLVDEVLAVGDFAFQLKCFKRMGEILESGATIVVVSHNLAAVRNLCPRSVVLHYGEKRYDGDTREAIQVFHDLLGEQRELDNNDRALSDAPISVAARFERMEALGPDGNPVSQLRTGEEIEICADVAFDRHVVDPVIGLAVVTAAGVAVYADSTPMVGSGHFDAGDRAAFRARVPLPVPTGQYEIELSLTSVHEPTHLARPPQPISVYVSGRTGVHGTADLHAQLEVARTESAEPA